MNNGPELRDIPRGVTMALLGLAAPSQGAARHLAVLETDAKALGACSRCDKPYHPSFLPPMVDGVY